MNAPAQNNPPRWMQSAVSALLPPTCREHVLGDLEERFTEREPGLRCFGYLFDAATTVPQLLRIKIRRIVDGSACNSASAGLRNRAELFQTQIWIRNALVLVGLVIVIAAFLSNAAGAWRLHESISLAMTIGWIGACWRSYFMHGRSTSVPAWLSLDELHTFHRRELMRQMDLGAREFVYWSIPAVLLILYGLAATVPGFRGGPMLLAAIAMQNGVVAWTHRKQRSNYQRELDTLDQEARQA